MSKTINAANIPINRINGTVPDVSGALQNYFQPMTFVPLSKTVSGFQVVESSKPIEFWGVIMPFTPRLLILKPEGQRSWTWFSLYAEPGIVLKTDDVIVYHGIQTRVMSRTNFELYGYVLYELVQDWTGAGP